MLTSSGADSARTPGSHDLGSSALEPRCHPSYDSVSPAKGRALLIEPQPTSPTVKAAGSLNSPVTSLAFDLISNLAVELSPGLKTPRRCLRDTLEAAKSAHRHQTASNMEIDSTQPSFLTVDEGQSRTKIFLAGSEEDEPMEDVKNDEDAISPLGRYKPAPCLLQTTLAFGPVVPSSEQDSGENNSTRPCIVTSRLRRTDNAKMKPPMQPVGNTSRNPFTKETASLTSHWSQRRNNEPPLIKDNAAKFKLQSQSIFGGQHFGTPTPLDFRSRNISRGEGNNFSVGTPTVPRGSSSARPEAAINSGKEDGSKEGYENRRIYGASPCMAPPSKFRRTQSASSQLFGNTSKQQHHGVRDCSSVPITVAPSQADSTILPCIETGRDAIKRISSSTLIDLINGNYQDKYDEHYVIDCRFPYEFEGGHIKSAVNVNSMDALENMLLRNPITGKKVVLIFHCEFSSQRAPRMALHLRNQDRQLNIHNYPNLNYPEVYILKGGYKEFFAEYKEHCLPQRYIEMADEAFKEECKTGMTLYKRSFKRSKSYTEGYGSSGNLSMTTKASSSMFFTSTSSFGPSALASTSIEKSAPPPVFGPFTCTSATGYRLSNLSSTVVSANPTSSSSGSQTSYLSSFSSSEEVIMECTRDT